MDIKIEGDLIEVATDAGRLFYMNWQEMSDLERAFKAIREINAKLTIANMKLTMIGEVIE